MAIRPFSIGLTDAQATALKAAAARQQRSASSFARAAIQAAIERPDLTLLGATNDTGSRTSNGVLSDAGKEDQGDVP